MLRFSCRFRPYRSKDADHDFICNLVFFSAFERLDLSSEAEKPMQNSGITMLYEPGPWDPENSRSKQPVLHVGYLEHILCRAPLMPCFLDGSSTNTIPISKRGESSAFPHGRTDTRAGAGDGSKVFEVNIPLWRFGRGKARTTSVDEAERLRAEQIATSRRQAAATKRQRRGEGDE